MTSKKPSAELADLNGPAAKDQSADIEDLKADFQTLQGDVKKLLSTLGTVAKGKSAQSVERGSELADDAQEKLYDTQAYVEKQVRTNPLTAMGIALGAGFLIASLRR